MRQLLSLILAKHAGKVITRELAKQIVEELCPDRTIDPGQFEPVHYNGYVLQVEHFSKVLPELMPLHEAQWLETERYRHGLALNPNYANMAERIRAGGGIQFTIRRDGELVGHLREWLFDSEHTGTPVAEEDTLYIAPQHRGTFLPMRLVQHASECVLKLKGSFEARVNSKVVNNADVLMRRLKYRHVANLFVKFFGGNHDA